MDKPHLLIVEDDLDLSEMLDAYFRVQNYEVSTATEGEEALQVVRDKTVDLVVLDIRLPDIDGFEVCRRLRSQRRTQEIPIIFLTEKRDRVDRLLGVELGGVDYITKPFDIQELRLRVRNAISRANRHALVNPVTDLPEGPTVDEKLTALLKSGSSWTILQMSISSLGKFRELYGFVAADDVLRAVTLMMRNAVREHGGAEDYIGHIGPEDFIIISQKGEVAAIRQRIESRIEQSREYFYPLKDREKAMEAMESHHLKVESGILNSESGPFADVKALKMALQEALIQAITARPAPEQKTPSSEVEPPKAEVEEQAEKPQETPASPAETPAEASKDETANS